MIVDVSKWQGNIDWGLLAPSLDFAIVKCTGDKHNGVDPAFEYNAAQCRARGVPMHLYHYLRALSVDDARKEAAYFYGVASPHNPISYVVDVEGDSLACGIAPELTRAFIAELRMLGAARVGLYTGHNAYTECGFRRSMADWLWIARYGDKNDGCIPDEHHRPVPCDLWQYSSHGKAPGIGPDVDVNIIWGDRPMDYFTTRGDDGMAVKVGSARGDENGGATGGRPGDQTGKEVSTQNWYKHAQGWRVFRAKDPVARERIAWDMQAACDNPHIGYDQNDRLTLYAIAEPVGFNCAEVTVDCETDCSALVRVCCAYAGIGLPNFNTAAEPRILLDSGAFAEMTGEKYTDSSDWLLRGDILVTRTKGHTVVVLTDGAKTGGMPVLRRGERDDKGDENGPVRQLQHALLAHGYSVGKDGADGDFGKNTEAAVRAFQKANGLTVDGEVGPATWAALNEPPKRFTVTICGLDQTAAAALAAKYPGCEVTPE